MYISDLTLSDLAEIERIHRTYYDSEFSLLDLSDKKQFVDPITIKDDNNKIICAGSIRFILESIIVTDKSRALHEKLEALQLMMKAQKATARNLRYQELHAFIINDNTWMQWLNKAGFVPTKGQALVLDLTKGLDHNG